MRKRERVKAATPSAFTVMNGVFGFLAILSLISGDISLAAIFVVGAIFLDFLDGLVARKLDVSSPFGLELDSLADTISFVVTPALMIALFQVPGWKGALLGGLAVACGIIRLARFNVTSSTDFYTGISTPLFAVLIVVMTTVRPEVSEPLLILLFILLSLSMISPFRFPSLRGKGLSKYKWISIIILVVLAYVVSVAHIPNAQVYLLEHLMLWFFLFIPTLFEPLRQKWRLFIFYGGMLLGLFLFSGMYDLLVIYPVFYLILGAPFLAPCFEEFPQ